MSMDRPRPARPGKKTAHYFSGLFLAGLALVLAQAGTAHGCGKLTASVAREYARGKSARVSWAIAAELGCDLEMVFAPLGRRLALLEEGELDFAVGLYRLPEREAYIHFVEPAYKRDHCLLFFLLKKSPVTINTYQDLYGLKIGTKIGSKYFERFDADDRLTKIPVATLEQSFEMLIRKRVDAVILSYGLGLHHIHKMGINHLIRSSGYAFQEHIPIYVGISRKSRLMERRDDMATILRRMIKNGQL